MNLRAQSFEMPVFLNHEGTKNTKQHKVQVVAVLTSGCFVFFVPSWFKISNKHRLGAASPGNGTSFFKEINQWLSAILHKVFFINALPAKKKIARPLY
jgi:hypothetical protein